MATPSKTEKIINELFLLARDKEPVARAKVVAALVYKGKIISYGFNQYRTSWVQRRFKKNPDAQYLHAEVDAIKNAMKNVEGSVISSASLYIVRSRKIGGKNVFGTAKPCSGCADCIDWFDIKKVFYTTDEGTVEQL